MRIVILSLAGAVGGAFAAVIWGPSALYYWATPPFQIPGCDYAPAIHWAMKYLLITEGVFIVGGAILVPVVFGLLFRPKPKAAAPVA
jgi:hypothetical protein